MKEQEVTKEEEERKRRERKKEKEKEKEKERKKKKEIRMISGQFFVGHKFFATERIVFKKS